MFHRVSFALMALLLSPTPVQPRSTGAPTCVSGESAPGEPHRDQDAYQDLPLSEGNVEITIDGELLVKGVTLGVPVGEDLPVKISRPIPFKGVMIRIGGGAEDIDTKAVFGIVDGDVNSKLKQNTEYCETDIGGITHSSVLDTTVLEFTMTFDEPARRMLLDVNIVELRTQTESRFFYDNFTISALAGGDTLAPNTAPPTSSPTMGNAQRPIGDGGLEESAATMTFTTGAIMVLSVTFALAAAVWTPY